MALDLQPAASQPEPISAMPQREAPLFAGTGLVASRGLLPQEWAEEIADERRSPRAFLETSFEDVRYGWRMIRRNPLFAAVVIVTLTVGIGINASVFTVVNGIALRPHIYKDPDSFVRVIPKNRLKGTWRQVSYAEYVHFRDHTRSLRQLAAFTYFPAMLGDDDPAETEGLAVSCNFFPVEGLDRAILGRLLVPEDCGSAAQAPAVVMSESLWRKRFSADPRIIGRTIQVNYRPAIVAGVVADRTSGWASPMNRPLSLWMPYTAMTYLDPGRDVFAHEEALWLYLAGRLAPGYSRSAAEAELDLLARQQDLQHPGRRTAVATTDGSWAAHLQLTASGRELMLIAFFLGTFNLVLFISCANVATLMLSRAAARNREIAVRLSLGAPRIRLVRMLVTESLLLAVAAGAVSVVLAWRVPEPLFRLIATQAPHFPMPPDWRTFAYIMAVVLITGILAGLAPALESLKVDLTASLKGSGGLLPGPGGGTRMRGLLVSLQVALSMVLLVEAGLFARSEDRALRADPGYSPQRVVVAHLFFGDKSTLESTAVRSAAIVQRVKALPGVRSVGFSDRIPLLFPKTIEMRPPGRQDASQAVDIHTASPGLFETLGIPIVRGRDFQPADGPSVIVSESLARAFWRRQDPIGQVLAFPGGSLPVVGVARDIEPMRIGGSENPPVYRLHRLDSYFNVMSVRFDAGASSGANAVRTAIRQVAPDMLVMPFLLQEWFDRVTATLWNVVALMVVLGIVGTVLATTGIYGAVSFAVNKRTRELGIRAALGASRWNLVREVLRAGGKPVWRGLIVGLWMSVAAAAGLRETFRGPLILDASEPLLYAAAALLLGAAALVAMLGPARRGAGSDPLDALRCE
jgi:predicted permease